MTIKKVDERIITLIQNGIRSKHRSMFVIIGDKSFDQIVNLHYMLRKESAGKSSTNFKVLWCYRDKLELSSHKKKQAKQVKALVRKGLLDSDKAGTFSLFLETARIEYCRYKDSDRILGNTYAMCILQDFEALTPNLLARTLETVEGGGLIVLLLRTLRSLTSLYTMVMDVHARFRTESHPWEAAGRFNERFILSLASCVSCIFMDDELNLLPISSHMKSVMPVPIQEDLPEAKCKLEDLKEELKDCFPTGPLMKKCCTLDQGKAVMNFLVKILDKTLCHTVALLAGRGRGKSAALGLAIAGAVAAGYSNIFVTAPGPENLKTLFQFVSKGFDMLNYKEHLDYDIVRSSDSELKNVVNRINIYKQHRQTIQYIQPHEHGKLSQVELLVVDEAAAIPLPVVKSLIGPYLVFLSSTVNGYEGTGRSLSLKLLQPLEQQSETSTDTSDVRSVRRFSKRELSEAIRYAPGDPVESWLNNLLCLDIKNSIPEIKTLSLPSECDLYYVNRDTLFSYHESTELFLQSMMALFAASHYKNSPNDLQLLADAPAHQLFVLLGPFNKLKDPDIFCVIQVCLEGNISKASVMRSLSAGHQPSGDQIPWKFCEQFQDTNFASLSGARIVRIATHPDAMRKGYGSVAIELLARYFKGQFVKTNSSKSEADVMNVPKSVPLKITEAAKQASLLEENIKPRSGLPLLFERVDLRQQPEKLHYLGVSFGLTLDLFRFWGKHKFLPFYICEVPNSVTGEHTCMMLKTLDTDDIEVNSSDDLGFFGPFYRAFRSSFTRLLCSPSFNTMEYKLAMSILHPKLDFTDSKSTSTIAHGGIYDDIVKSPISMRKLEAYVNSLGHHHLISDLKLPLAYLYFQEKLPVNLSPVQASVLLCMGLQNQDVSYVEGVMLLEKHLILSYFMQVMKKFYKYLESVTTQQFSATLPPVEKAFLRPHSVSVDEDLVEAAKKVKDDFKVKSGALLNPEPSHRYAISNEDVDFENALKNGSGSLPSGGIVSVKSNKTKSEKLDKSDGKTKKKRKASLMD